MKNEEAATWRAGASAPRCSPPRVGWGLAPVEGSDNVSARGPAGGGFARGFGPGGRAQPRGRADPRPPALGRRRRLRPPSGLRPDHEIRPDRLLGGHSRRFDGHVHHGYVRLRPVGLLQLRDDHRIQGTRSGQQHQGPRACERGLHDLQGDRGGDWRRVGHAGIPAGVGRLAAAPRTAGHSDGARSRHDFGDGADPRQRLCGTVDRRGQRRRQDPVRGVSGDVDHGPHLRQPDHGQDVRDICGPAEPPGLPPARRLGGHRRSLAARGVTG